MAKRGDSAGDSRATAPWHFGCFAGGDEAIMPHNGKRVGRAASGHPSAAIGRQSLRCTALKHSIAPELEANDEILGTGEGGKFMGGKSRSGPFSRPPPPGGGCLP